MIKKFAMPFLILSFLITLSCALKKTASSSKTTSAKIDGEFEFVLNQQGDMALIPGGMIDIGSTYSSNEGPVHQIRLESFFLDIKEVTVAEFRQFCQTTRRIMPKQPYWNYDTHPVVNVSWDEANEYAAWIGKRLPGEFEWEFAAKSGALQETHYISFLGKATLGNVADEALRNIKFHYPAVDGYNDGFVYTSPVASFKPNKFGIYDLDGNVLEWCADWYIAPYNAPNNSLAKDKIEAGRYRVIRGVSWNRGRNYIRSTFRTYYPPSVKYDFVGFRCAKDYVESTLASNRK